MRTRQRRKRPDQGQQAQHRRRPHQRALQRRPLPRPPPAQPAAAPAGLGVGVQHARRRGNGQNKLDQRRRVQRGGGGGHGLSIETISPSSFYLEPRKSTPAGPVAWPLALPLPLDRSRPEQRPRQATFFDGAAPVGGWVGGRTWGQHPSGLIEYGRWRRVCVDGVIDVGRAGFHPIHPILFSRPQETRAIEPMPICFDDTACLVGPSTLLILTPLGIGLFRRGQPELYSAHRADPPIQMGATHSDPKSQ